MLWENLREEEFDDAIARSGGLCVVPIGCLEKHGEHLPVGSDYYIAKTIIEAAAEVEDVMIPIERSAPSSMRLISQVSAHCCSFLVRSSTKG